MLGLRFSVPEVIQRANDRVKTSFYELLPRFFFKDRTLRPAGEEHYKLVVAISDLLNLSLDEALILLNGISRITSATMHTLKE